MDLRTPEGREALRVRIAHVTDPPLNALAVLLLILLILEFTAELPPQWTEAVLLVGTAIWLVFLVEFLVELALAVSKLDFLRDNWLLALSVIVPLFRPLLALRAVRSLRLVPAFASFGRSVDILKDIFRGRGFRYVLLLTAIVMALGSASLYFIERDTPNTSFATYGSALWWVAATITTVSTEGQPVTLEGRIIGLSIMVYGLAVFGYLTATIASFLVGRRNKPDVERIEALRRENYRLRRKLKNLTDTVRREEEQMRRYRRRRRKTS